MTTLLIRHLFRDTQWHIFTKNICMRVAQNTWLFAVWKPLVSVNILKWASQRQNTDTHHNLRGCGTWDKAIPASPGTVLADRLHPGTDIDPQTAHKRGRTFETVRHWAGGWYTRWCDLVEPGDAAVTHTVCKTSCPVPCNMSWHSCLYYFPAGV
jgi:hypothetical protein